MLYTKLQTTLLNLILTRNVWLIHCSNNLSNVSFYDGKLSTTSFAQFFFNLILLTLKFFTTCTVVVCIFISEKLVTKLKTRVLLFSVRKLLKTFKSLFG